jgi:Xaa-Pro dipeptidase
MTMDGALHRRDLIGQDVVDYEDRVDMARLKRARLARLQAEIARADLGGVLLYDPANIRYATGIRFCGLYSYRFFQRYTVVPREGRPILFGWSDPDMDETLERRRALFWDYFPCGRHVHEAVERWAGSLHDTLKDLGIAGERIGVDRLDFLAFEALRAQPIVVADARIPVERARAIKTPDEIALIKQACAISDVAICAVKDAIRPGVTENELFAILTATNMKYGGEHMDSRLLTAGGNTKPWFRYASDRIVRAGDLVAFDTDMAGPLGYFTDVSRTYLCGDTRPTADQKEAYRVAYDFIQTSIPLFRPGQSFQEIAEKAPPFPEEYKANRYVLLAHGVGMSDEWPSIYFPDVSWSGYGNDADVLEENMVICVEALAGRDDGRECVKLEEQIVITRGGPELISFAPYDTRLLDY